MIQHDTLQEEAARCLLCFDAPCSTNCAHGDPARFIRAIRFDNLQHAGQWIINCSDEELLAAEKACIHYDRPIRIRELAHAIEYQTYSEGVPNLAIDFCGIRCENPFFLASSSICTQYEMIAQAFKAGWAGVFYKTICIQDIHEVSPRFDAIRDKSNSEFVGFRNMEQLSENPYTTDFEILHRLKQDFPTKVVVASIMGTNDNEWIELAQMAEKAGVDAVELNFSCPQMQQKGLGSDVGQEPELVRRYTSCVKKAISIPVIPKMTPNITHIVLPALGAYQGGADAISAINTIKSVTISEDAEVSGKLTISGYSGKAIKPIALRMILEMSSHPQLQQLQLSGIGGIETWRDALDFISIGCRNIQVCTAVMQYGYRIIDDLISGLQSYMQQHGFIRVDELVGCQLSKFASTDKLDRDSIVYPTFDHQRCVGCGRCYISCRDGGHQAIQFDLLKRVPRIIGKNCVGCHLCHLVCPTQAIGYSRRVTKK